ncbi:hypothetical protein [Cryptosporangium sp. NPDC051539]|uniref:hypothetical protein n=1 Tax=Cryptosporangium sp. NPDC051539 TaxID=3363962 RepID=UPI00378CE869
MTSTVPAPAETTVSVADRVKDLYDNRALIVGVPDGIDDLVADGWVGVETLGGYPSMWVTSAGMALCDLRIVHVHSLHQLPSPEQVAVLRRHDLIALDEATGDWWITDRGLSLLGLELQAEPATATPTYTVSWRRDGVRRATDRGLGQRDARRHVDVLLGQLRAGDRISRITVLDDRGVDATSSVAGDLFPAVAELAALARRAEVLSGLRDAIDFLATHPGALTPPRPYLVHHVRDRDPESARNIVYVAAAAIEADVVEDHGSINTRKQFGPVTYVVQFDFPAAAAAGGDQ